MKLAGALGLHVPGVPVAPPPQRLAGPFGQQPGPLRAVMLEHEQTLPPGGQPVPAQQPLHGAGRQAQAPEAVGVGRQPGRAPRRFGDGHREQAPLDGWGQVRHRARPGAQAARMDPVHAIALQPPAPPVEQGARDASLAAGCGHPDRLCPLHDTQSHSLYALVQGHRSILPKWSLAGGCHSGNDRPDGPLLFAEEVSTLTRLRTL